MENDWCTRWLRFAIFAVILQTCSVPLFLLCPTQVTCGTIGNQTCHETLWFSSSCRTTFTALQILLAGLLYVIPTVVLIVLQLRASICGKRIGDTLVVRDVESCSIHTK
jgi:hypothetical protein